MNNSVQSDHLTFTTKELRALNLFWLGFIFYTCGDTLSSLLVSKYHVNYNICQFLQITGIIIFAAAASFLIQFKLDNKYLKVVYLIYIFWLFIIIARGFSVKYDYLKDMLFNGAFGIFPYLVPFILLFPQKLIFYKKAFDIIFILSAFYVIYDIFFIKDLLNRDIGNGASQSIVEFLTKNLAMPCGFLLLTYVYQPGKRKFFVWFVVALSIFFAIIRARRGTLLILSGPVIFFYIFYLVQNKSKGKFTIITLSVFLVGLITINGLKFFSESSLFASLKTRGLENTRISVEDCFYNSLSRKEWIIGGGINGQYYCPGIDEDDETGYRTVIETDYLNIILKGGLVSLSLLLLIAVPAFIKGIFYSNNILSKAAGVWILLWMISLYPFSATTFNMNYLLVWISIAICYNKAIRNMPESKIKAYFLTTGFTDEKIKVISIF